MSKEKLIEKIIRGMYKGQRKYASFNAYKSIRNYFFALDIEDLIAIANCYGVR